MYDDEWCRYINTACQNGITEQAFRMRVKNGMTPEEACLAPTTMDDKVALIKAIMAKEEEDAVCD